MLPAMERIDAICKHGGFRNLKALAKAIGLKTPQRLYDIQSGKTKDISTDLGEKILLVYQEINPDWVYRGEGEMLKEPPGEENVAGVTIPQELVRMFTNMTESARIQEENIAKLAEMVNRLTGGAEKPKKESAG